jgi:signal peptide peptidase SppA
MRYAHIASYVRKTPWAITSEKLHEILSILAFRAAGGEQTAEELRARLGGDAEPQAAASKRGAVAVIPIRGVIAHRMGGMDETSGGTSTERIGAMLRAIAADESIGTIVYDIDSPGGTAPGVQELAAQMFALRGQKKQIALVNSLAASAGYWLASQADEIVSIPSGMAGSIGVFSVHEDLSQLLEKEGVKVTLISAGKHKVAGNPFEPLSDDEKAVIQARVDEAYGQFVKDVARGRGVSVSDVRTGYGEGRVLTAKDAKAAGLIDRIATMDETIARLVGRKSSGGLRAECEGGEALIAAGPITKEQLEAIENTVSEGLGLNDTISDEDRASRLRML